MANSMVSDLRVCVRVLAQRWKVLTLVGGVGAVLGLGGALLQKPQWEAVGLVAYGTYVEAQAKPVEVDTQSNVLVRLRSLDTARGVLASMNIPYTSVGLSELSSGTRLATAGDDMVELRVRAYSPEQATAVSKAYVDELVKAERRLVERSGTEGAKKYIPPHFESGPTVLPEPINFRPLMLVVFGSLIGLACAIAWVFGTYEPLDR